MGTTGRGFSVRLGGSKPSCALLGRPEIKPRVVRLVPTAGTNLLSPRRFLPRGFCGPPLPAHPAVLQSSPVSNGGGPMGLFWSDEPGSSCWAKTISSRGPRPTWKNTYMLIRNFTVANVPHRWRSIACGKLATLPRVFAWRSNKKRAALGWMAPL